MVNAIKIPFNKPCFEGKELIYIAEAIGNGLGVSMKKVLLDRMKGH